MPSPAPSVSGASGPVRVNLAARVLYKDEAMLVLDKPPGIAVHKGPGYGDNLEAHFESLRFGMTANPALAHRLDKDTSGCLVLGRDKPALARLGRMFKEGRVAKTYWAVVMGNIAAESGRIEAPVMRRSHEKRSWWMKVDPMGDPAFTDWRVLGRCDGLTWLELKPETGRTHQLRVHCAHMDAPIAGDHVYGGDRSRAGARHMHLHARAISIPYDVNNPVRAMAEPPAHMHMLLGICGWTASRDDGKASG
jgi:tRNA pseudouridine32 synthase / 23S rRNA pseudouridine746 synthase